MTSVSSLALSQGQKSELLIPFILHFLEAATPIYGEQTGGAPTSTETGDGNGPTKIDTVEDEDVTDDD